MMSSTRLEDLLGTTDLSDDSDVEPSDSSCSTLTPRSGEKVDYTEILNTLLQDGDCESPLTSTGEASPHTPLRGTKVPVSTDTSETNGCYMANEISPTRAVSITGSTSCTDGIVNLYSPQPITDTPTDTSEAQAAVSGQSDSDTKDDATDRLKLSGDATASVECECRYKYRTAIGQLVNTSLSLLGSIRSVVRRQVDTMVTAHKLSYLQHSKRAASGVPYIHSDPDVDSVGDGTTDAIPILNPSRSCLESLGLSYKRLDIPKKRELLIRCRHNASAALEKLRLFKDDFIDIDATKVNRIGPPPYDSLLPSCIAAGNHVLVIGTSNGSILVSDISNHNTKRQFKPNDDAVHLSDLTVGRDLVWQEIDAQSDAGVTCVDVLPDSNWICVGYSNGLVKLLRLNKDSVQTKAAETGATDVSEGGVAHDGGHQGRGFGLMADAVSSAFGGFRKSGPHVICSAKPFNDAVTTCIFTIGESHEEVLCANSSFVSLLSYSKTVLSHNLNIRPMEAFTERLLENDDIVDVACLSSNPQSRFITGATVGGLVALATIKRCVVIATRPELSILFRVPFTDRPKDSDDSAYAMPSITWMVLNNSGDIMPVLLIVLGSRISFTLCNLSSGKRGGPPVSCTHIGYIRFDTVIRNVRTVSRDLFAVVDYNNVMHVVQVNVFHSIMHYDIVRSFDLGVDNMVDLWQEMVNIGPTISVHVRTVKMMANSYKKFSALVSDIFHGKRNESFFDLRVVSFYILTSKGIRSSEIHSWIKCIGDLTATKQFGEAFAISYALYGGILPGLLDYKAYVDNIQKLIVYVLHQACAHIIRLSKLVDSDSITAMDEDNSDGWTDKVKDDIISQIDNLCCAMFDICLRLNLYDCLNDLLFRCFATVGMQHVFVKYVLLNFYQGRMDLVRLKPTVFESIFDFYGKLLDSMQTDYLSGCDHVEDSLVFLRDEVEHRNKGQCPVPGPHKKQDVNDKVVVYELLCNHISRLYVFCSRNEISFNKERAVYMLSKHAQWQALVYCPDLIGEDISVALEILYSEASSRVESLHNVLSPSSMVIGHLPWNRTESLYVLRVLYSILNSFLTFENCGLAPESAVTNFCKVLGCLMSTSSSKPSFPLSSDVNYARSELLYDDDLIDFENMDRLGFETTCGVDSVSPTLQMLMSFSPRLLFACFANLMMAPNSTFESNTDILGSKIDVFNFLVNALIGCLSTFEAAQSTFTIRCMLSMFILGVSVFSEQFYLALRTQVVAIYTLLTEVSDVDSDPFLDPAELTTIELILPDGSFNNAYFLHSFCKRSEELFDNVRQFNVTESTTRELLKLHIRRTLFAIYRKFDCQSSWTQNAHFGNLKRMCSGLIPLVCDFETRVFLCEVAGDYGSAIQAWESAGGDQVFIYIQQCLACIKAGVVEPDCSVRELLLVDPAVQKDFVATLMDALPHLIRVDLKSATSLLVEIFSLSNLVSVFKETALQSSQDIVLSTLKDTPELQLMVLNALLGTSQPGTGVGVGAGSGDYFNQYLRLLCKDDPKSVCPFLKRQQKLDIGDSLSICISAGIHDAVAYLLMRAGDFAESASWLLDSFHAVGDDLDWCLRLVHDACILCIRCEEFTSRETLELLWFGILQYLVERDPLGERYANLIEEVFTNGIYKFTRLKEALVELKRYDSARVSSFKSPLRRLLCDAEFQTFVSNASSTMCTTVLREEFRRSLGYNRRGVVVGGGHEIHSSEFLCGVCRREIWPSAPSDEARARETPVANGAARSPSHATSPASNSLSSLERQLGVIYSLPQSSEKQGTEAIPGNIGITHLTNLYSDRLSTLVNKKPPGLVGRANWFNATSLLLSQLTSGMPTHTKGVPRWDKSFRVFWCGHFFHTACSPRQCATCGLCD
ncbi:uncharacterized protein BXIN_0117 [Babesia sp. Xinjiang]|uniref:uncharacterized protein n=1 Tax=Babesia sp. Xinjiang TaxID=462227 RepID=UPI000A215AAC|nr:uncharacterized protein BXIN_0117 [Babesia sp. Xinjiang]ORM39679.1 hypothetical protein BXIN_0117 [Babesia sp. Xinjiang]